MATARTVLTEGAFVHTVTSFHASGLKPEQLRAVTTDYLVLERARAYRRLSVARFAALALVVAIAGPGLHWIPPVASWLGAGLCVTTPAWAWAVEVRRERMLTRRLSELREGATTVVVPPEA